jgi:hypothetical protein
MADFLSDQSLTVGHHWHVADSGKITVYRGGVPVAVIPPEQALRLAAQVVAAAARLQRPT